MKEKDWMQYAQKTMPELFDTIQALQSAGLLAEHTHPKNQPLTVLAGNWSETVDGSISAYCEQCQGRVVLAPTTQTMLENRTAETHILCLTCNASNLINELL